MAAELRKIAALCIKDNKILLVYKKSIGWYITPGGKIDSGETDLDCLKRELKEEVGCEFSNAKFYETFQSITHDNKTIEIKTYLCDLVGDIKLNPNDSITAYVWAALVEANSYPLSETLRDQILPSLVRNKLLS